MAKGWPRSSRREWQAEQVTNGTSRYSDMLNAERYMSETGMVVRVEAPKSNISDR